MPRDRENWHGYEWTALSVTTVGALLASIQGSALLIGINTIAFSAGFLMGLVIWGIQRLREPVALPSQQSFDWPGSVTFTVGLAALLLASSLVAFPLIDAAYV